MNKLPTSTYFIYRILFPGVWFSILLIINLIIHDINFYQNFLTDKIVFSILSVLSVVFGLIIHYLVNYPRKRKRFKLIEKEDGPVDFLINRIKQKYPNIFSKLTRKKVYNFYFGILNDDIPQNTKERIYYFSSIYYLIYHIGFISIIFIFINLIIFFAKSFSILNGMFFPYVTFCFYYPSIIEILLLVIFCIIILKKEGQGERYLRLMFNIQKDWVERNWSIVENKFLDSFNTGIVLDNNNEP